MSVAPSPTKLSLGRDLIADRHPEVRHPVQRRASNEHLRRLPVKAARADSLAEDHLHAEDRRLSQGAPVVAALALPLCAPLPADGSQVLVAGVALTLRVAVVPDARPISRRDGCSRFPLSYRVITVAAVVGSVRRDPLDLTLDLLKQVGKYLRVFEATGRDGGRHQLMRGLVHREVELAPGAALRVPVLAHLPLALA